MSLSLVILICHFLAQVHGWTLNLGIYTVSIPNIEDIPTILTRVNDIPKIVTETDKIPSMLQSLAKLITSPLGDVLDVIDDETAELSAAISTCVSAVNNILAPPISLAEVIPLPDVDLPINPADLALTAIAITLLPLKDSVIFACNGISDIIDLVDTFRGSSEARRRAMAEQPKRRLYDYEDGDCDRDTASGLCNPSTPVYQADVDPVYLANIRAAGGIVKDDYGWTHAGVHFAVRNMNSAFKTIYRLLADVCSEGAKCLAEPASKCKAEADCMKAKLVFTILSRVIDFIIDSAERHNAKIDLTHRSALFKDRESIIHNQFVLYDLTDTRFASLSRNFDNNVTSLISDIKTNITTRINQELTASTTNINTKIAGTLADVQSAVLGITAAVENTFYEDCSSVQIKIEQIEAKVNQLNAAFTEEYPGAKLEIHGVMDEVPEKVEDGGLITLRLTKANYGILIWILIALGVIVLTIGISIGLFCCTGFGLPSGVVTISKYDYSENEMDPNES